MNLELENNELENINKMGTVSIIIPTYNNSEYLFDNLDSVLCQDYPNIELIISDDGSEYFEAERFEQYIKEKSKGNIVNSIISVNETNLGIVKNINKAIKLSCGDYIKCIAADDLLCDEKALTEYIHFLENNKQYDIVFSDSVLCFPDGRKEIGKIEKEKNDQIKRTSYYTQLCVSNLFIAGSACFRKSFFEKYGLFDERFFLLEDWPMWLNSARKGCEYGFLSKPLFEYRVSIGVSGGNSSLSPKYKNDLKLCYDLCILPYIKQVDKCERIGVLDNYYVSFIHHKNLWKELVFLVRYPRYLWYKAKRKLFKKPLETNK